MRLRRYRTKSELPPFALPRGPRAVGLLLMVAGVGGFFLGRLMFGEQVLCLVASTLVTFGGLAIIIRARQNQQAADQGDGDGYAPAQYAQNTVSTPARPQRQPYTSADLLPPLAARVMRIFRQQGAQVAVENRLADRCILQVSSPQGEVYAAMVLEGPELVDTPDVRALYALVSSAEYSGGYLICGGEFTERAELWAQGKPLRLVSAEELGNLSV